MIEEFDLDQDGEISEAEFVSFDCGVWFRCDRWLI